MGNNFIAEQFRHRNNLLAIGGIIERRLQIGQGAVHFQRMQRGVVPAIFHQRGVGFTRLVRRLAHGILAAILF